MTRFNCFKDTGRLVIVLAALLPAGWIISGCSGTQSVANARTRFAAYDRVAILSNLDRSEEEYFIPQYMIAFPNQQLVERRDLADVLGEQDLAPDRLDPQKRVDLKRLFGVEAIVYPNFSGTDEASQFAVKVIDTETGEIVAAALITPKSGWMRSEATRRDMMTRAIDALEGEKNRAITASLRTAASSSSSRDR